MTSFTPEQVRTAIASLHWRANFHDFCRILGLNEDDYAYDKFQAFRDMEKSVRVLGTLFDRLLQEYAETAVRR